MSSARLIVNSLKSTHIYRVPRFLLDSLGIWPQETGKVPVRFYVLSVILCTASVASIAFGLVNIKHLNEALQALCPSVFEFVTWVKLMLFWYHLKTATKVLTALLHYYKLGKWAKVDPLRCPRISQ